jgi:hypothetical protein
MFISGLNQFHFWYVLADSLQSKKVDFDLWIYRVAIKHTQVYLFYIYVSATFNDDRLCGLVVSVEDYKHRGPGFDSRALLRIFLRELGLKRGPLSLVIG